MQPLRVQFIGFDSKDLPKQKEGENFRNRRVTITPDGYIPQEIIDILDYQLVFVNYPLSYSYPRDIEGRFREFTSGRTVLCVIAGPSETYPWDPRTIKVKEGSGEFVVFDSKHWLGKILKKYRWRWRCYFEKGELLELREMGKELGKIMAAQMGKGAPVKAPEPPVVEKIGTNIGGQVCVSCVVT